MINVTGTKQRDETHGLIALAWNECQVNDAIQIVQSNDLGGKSLEKRLLKIFPDASSESKNKSRTITITKTKDTPESINEWLEHTKLRLISDTGFYSMPGLFGWNKIDVGSQLLTKYLEKLKGNGADFGCGYGYLSKYALENNEKIKSLHCLDFDDRAVEACKKNIDDDRAIINQADCSQAVNDLPRLDFIIMNPPFHDDGGEDRGLGQRMIEVASHHLKPNGRLLMVANKHLPYEKTLEDKFKKHDKIAEEKGFKIFKALK